jgi:hypothetical protein
LQLSQKASPLFIFIITDLFKEIESVALTFKHEFGEAGFSELMVPDFQFVRSPSCELPLTFGI